MRANKLGFSRANISLSLSLGVLVCYLNDICRSASFAPGYILITLPHCYSCSNPFLEHRFPILNCMHQKNNFDPAFVTVHETSVRRPRNRVNGKLKKKKKKQKQKQKL
jgi:hypothetical protein